MLNNKVLGTCLSKSMWKGQSTHYRVAKCQKLKMAFFFFLLC